MRESDVTIVEVGPRDGLQSVQQTMPTAAKLRWVDALAAAGLERIQVGSFVSARALPQPADCAEARQGRLDRTPVERAWLRETPRRRSEP